ncbi:Zn-dependent oxidoreductase, NADPH:quinone reductase [Thermus oshimai JL-2]|uniref:Zn-dependent oxidoreductase, NADPH:quinone reductase n=1 Tax=Thermus oshimai JL-2 TaxID=751945 RepID=K7RIB5_THEOS|nr:zinc-binding dehydrogenase [Thermus oshimai]AFV76142.1 Zn-dependent oxidoreductase, NADPH:quinone reductase [Thermus oshimai JL-2]
MRAWVQEALGRPMVLKEVPEPIPGPGEVLLEVEAVGLNFADHLLRLGGYLTRVHPPFVPGMEAVGRVEGRRYAALMGHGGLAERVAVKEEALLPLPEGLGLEEAAAFPVSFLTAYLALKGVPPGAWVLVQAAGGALGTAAIQVAKTLGLRVVAAASRPEKLALAQGLGADLASTYETLPERVKELGGVEAILEVRGKLEESLGLLKPGGTLVYVGAAEGEVVPLNPLRLMRKNLTVRGFWLAPLLQDRPLLEEALGFLLPRLGQTLKPVVGQVFPFAEAEAAFQALLDRGHVGKVVVRVR